MMRHKSIDTTLRYYVGRNAAATADEVWKAYERQAAGDTLGDSSELPLINNPDRNPQPGIRF